MNTWRFFRPEVKDIFLPFTMATLFQQLQTSPRGAKCHICGDENLLEWMWSHEQDSSCCHAHILKSPLKILLKFHSGETFGATWPNYFYFQTIFVSCFFYVCGEGGEERRGWGGEGEGRHILINTTSPVSTSNLQICDCTWKKIKRSKKLPWSLTF